MKRQSVIGLAFSPGYVTLLAAKNAKLDLESGFTTARDLSSGGTRDVDLPNAINDTRKGGAVADQARE